MLHCRTKTERPFHKTRETTTAVIAVISSSTQKRGERVNSALYWPFRLVCMLFKTKEYLTADSSPIQQLFNVPTRIFKIRKSLIHVAKSIWTLAVLVTLFQTFKEHHRNRCSTFPNFNPLSSSAVVSHLPFLITFSYLSRIALQNQTVVAAFPLAQYSLIASATQGKINYSGTIQACAVRYGTSSKNLLSS